MITDCHIHIQPVEMFKPGALAAMKKKRANFEQIVEFCGSPRAFLKHLDAPEPGIDHHSRAQAVFVLATVCDGHPRGQALCYQANLLGSLIRWLQLLIPGRLGVGTGVGVAVGTGVGDGELPPVGVPSPPQADRNRANGAAANAAAKRMDILLG